MSLFIGAGRPSKNKTSCTWCGENKQPLKYVLPTQHGKKEFCSETCLSEFRKAYMKVRVVCNLKNLKGCNHIMFLPL